MANVYNTIYIGNFCSPNGVDNVIEFKQRMSDADPVPTPSDIIFAGHDNAPVQIDYQDKGDYKLEAINGAECSINIKAIGDFELSSLYTADEREWQVVVTGDKSFIGWLIPDSCNEPYASKPYDVSVSATDAVGTLSDVPFLQSDGTYYKGWMNDLDILISALSKTGLSLPFLIAVNTFESQMNTSLSPLIQTYRNVAAYVDTDGNAFSCYEVIRSIMAHWSARLHQFDGRWQIVNVLELSTGIVAAKAFSNVGTFLEDTTIGNTIIAGGFEDEVQPVGNQSFAKAFASSVAYYKYGYGANQLLNGNMDTWTTNPTGLPNGWSFQAGATGHAETRISDGQPTTDHFIVIDSSGASGFLYNSNQVLVRAGETTKISFDLYAPDAAGDGLEFVYLGVRIADTDGNFFTAENGWQNAGGFYVIQYRKSDVRGQISVNFDVSARPNDYNLLFGVQSLQEAGSGGDDYPTKINNVQVTPSVTADQTKPPVGIFERDKSLTSQTYTSDPILLLHGDEGNPKRTSQISIGNPSPNPIIPVSWERSGITETSSLLHIVADSELRMHGKPYRLFEAIFIGLGDIDINTRLTVQFLDGVFIFLSGTFDLKTGEHSLRFAQALTETIPAAIDVREDYGQEKDKNGVSVGAPSGVNAPSSGTSYVDLSGYAKITDIPVKADASETAAGTNDDKFITPFKLLGWWTNIKTLAATISGLWNFTTRPTYNGSGLITSADLPAETDTLSSVTARGSSTPTNIQISNQYPYLNLNSATKGNFYLQSGINKAGSAAGDYLNILAPNGAGFNFKSGSNDYFSVDTSGNVNVYGRAAVGGAPFNPTDVVRLMDMQAFAPSYIGVSANYSILTTDGTINVTANSPTITLPTAIGVAGKIYRIKNSGTGSVTIATTAGQLLDGVSTKIINTQYSMFAFQSNGANWMIIAVL